MRTDWDAIVIGAGLGGLSTAARLTQAGLQVLVLEKSPHPGGTAYTYTRKGFFFPMGPLGFSTPGFVTQTLADIYQPDSLPLSRVHYSIHAFGKEILLSQPFSQLSKTLVKQFPEEKKGIETFFRDLKQVLSAMHAPEVSKNRSILENTKDIPAKKYLESLISDWRLRRFLGSLGTHEPYSSIPLMAAMWNLMSEEGIWYPKGGMRSISDRLAKAVTTTLENGIPKKGEIRLGVPVKKICIENNRTTGVMLKDGATVSSNYVISNADFKTTFLKLMPPSTVPETMKKAIQAAKQTGSVMQVCIGVDTGKLDLSAFSHASRLLYRKASGSSPPSVHRTRWENPEIDDHQLVSQELEIALMTREDPGLAPPGCGVVVIRTEADYRHFSRFRSPERRRIDSYRAYKERLANVLIQEIAHVIPGLEDAIEVIDIATPLTFEDQGGRSQGAVAGWSWDFEDTVAYTPLQLTRTPIAGLFMAGYQAYSTLFMGGVPTALESGRIAAEAVLNDTPPVDHVHIPGTQR
jgi:phytoene dehydrogenase-like protein